MSALIIIIRRWENTVPNFITLSRLILCLWGLHIFYWWAWSPEAILFLCALSAGLDGIDGLAARMLNQHSESGKMLDPLVDKICTWNLVCILAHYFAFYGQWPSLMLAIVTIPPLFLLSVYDYATMSMRATDPAMQTNDSAKLKQVFLFVSLCVFLTAIVFLDNAQQARGSMRIALFATHYLIMCIGVATMFQAMRMAAESSRIYLKATTDPRAAMWRNMRWVSWVLRTV